MTLAELMLRIVQWDQAIDKIRREIATSNDGENTRQWKAAYLEADQKRGSLIAKVNALLPSGSYQNEHKTGFKRV